MLKRDYADDSQTQFFSKIIDEMLGYPWGKIVNFLLKIFSQSSLNGFVDQIVRIFGEKIFLNAPSLLALVPDYSYPEIRSTIKNESVLKEADSYYAAQKNLKSRFASLEKQVIEFSFIAGYGLSYGSVSKDIKLFAYMKHAELTNSDEIVNISSTAPGTSYVAYNSIFSDSDGRCLSPDGSIDISTCYYPDRTWYFYGQKHVFMYNNTAIKLALDLVCGKVKTVQDCDGSTNRASFYPQFNGARDLSMLQQKWLPDLRSYLSQTRYELTDEQQSLYDEVIAMTESTVNNYEADNALLQRFYGMLVEIGVYTQ